MIYPKTIFRTVIALSTVATTTQATVTSPPQSAYGAKRQSAKSARYIDTTGDLYVALADGLHAVSSTTVAASTASTQAGEKLRQVTSPGATGGQFSYASPTNASPAGTSGHVTVIGFSPAANVDGSTVTKSLVANPSSAGNYGDNYSTGQSTGAHKVVSSKKRLHGHHNKKGSTTAASVSTGGYGSVATPAYGNNPTDSNAYGANKGNQGGNGNSKGLQGGNKGRKGDHKGNQGGYGNHDGYGGQDNYGSTPTIAPITTGPTVSSNGTGLSSSI